MTVELSSNGRREAYARMCWQRREAIDSCGYRTA